MNGPLDRAVSALVARSDREPVDAAETRSRLMRSVVRKENAQRVRWAAGVVGALLLTNSVTWAWSTQRLPRAAGIASTWLAPSPEDEQSPTGPRRVVERSPLGPAVADSARGVELPTRPPLAVADAPQQTSVPTPSRRSPAPVARARVDAESGTSIAALVGESVLDTRDRERFAEAHELHFERTDPRLALRAWDRYLAEFPDGRFVPEARWNRALCLVRLDDRGRAAAALAPFAEGAHGGVRQREARALSEAIGAR